MIKKTVIKSIYNCRSIDLLNVVSDVKSYAEFIPFCSAVEIKGSTVSRELECFSACILIDLKFTTETFSTKVVVDKKLKRISITGNTKPFKSLVADWSFIEQDDLCKVTFSLEVSFNSFVKEKLVSVSFEKVAFNIIEAFEKRAKEKKSFL
jgi:coenzyme Q-binding protein COQ10